MLTVETTNAFDAWLAGLRDRRGRTSISQRITRLAAGQLGDVKSVGDRVSELRIDTGPGYRLYFTRRGGHLIVLLCGGDKSSQSRDIARAKALEREL
jgi:putative addiction module killer protein